MVFGSFSMRIFPDVFQMVRNERPLVADYVSLEGGVLSWSPILRGGLSDWEIDSVANLLGILDRIYLRVGHEDKEGG